MENDCTEIYNEFKKHHEIDSEEYRFLRKNYLKLVQPFHKMLTPEQRDQFSKIMAARGRLEDFIAEYHFNEGWDLATVSVLTAIVKYAPFQTDGSDRKKKR